MLLAAGALGAMMTSGPAHAHTLSADDRMRIADVITGIGLYADLRQWDTVGTLLADRVTTDYVSVFGGEPTTAPRAGVLDQWRATLGGFDATQHQISNVQISPTDGGATALSHVRAIHLYGGRQWTVGGVYTHELVKADGAWQVTFMGIRMLYEDGDRGVLEASAK